MTRKDIKVLTLTVAGIVLGALFAFIVIGSQINALESQDAPAYRQIEITAAATPSVEPADEPAPEQSLPVESEEENRDEAVELIGRTIWGEAGGVLSKAERAAVAWCILNRVDAWGQTIADAVTAPYQFQGYRDSAWGECPQEHLDLAADVLSRWEAEQQGAENVGRVLPADYLYFMGDGERNHFTVEYLSTDYWGWSMTDPYK